MAGLYDFKGENLDGLLANNVTYTKGKPFGFTADPRYYRSRDEERPDHRTPGT